MDAMMYFNRTQRISSNLEAGERQRKAERPEAELNAEFLHLLGQALNGQQRQVNSPESNSTISGSLFGNGLLGNNLFGNGVTSSGPADYDLFDNDSAGESRFGEYSAENGQSGDKPDVKDSVNYDLLSNGLAGAYRSGEDTKDMELCIPNRDIGLTSNLVDGMHPSSITVAQEQQSKINPFGNAEPKGIQSIQGQGETANLTSKIFGFEKAADNEGMAADKFQGALAMKESGSDLNTGRLTESQSGLTAEQPLEEKETSMLLSGYSAVKDTDLQSLSKTGEPYQQISREILDRLEKKGTGEFKLQLEPENLGQIDIKLKWAEGKLIIDILAFSPKTHALLASQVDKLVMSMGLQNVQVEQIQVSQSASTDMFNPPQHNQSFLMNSGMGFTQGRQQERDYNQSDSAYSEPLTETKSELMEMPQNREYDGYQLNYVI